MCPPRPTKIHERAHAYPPLKKNKIMRGHMPIPPSKKIKS